MKRLSIMGVVGMSLCVGSLTRAQDYSVLRINEVIADNNTQGPADVGGAHVDMVEIYNSGDEPLVVGASNDSQSLSLTDTATLPLDPAPWRFPNATTIQPGKSLIVFCDGDAASQGSCEPHTAFNIASDGSEPITLWGPVTGMVDGKPVRQIIDQVWLPPLGADVSFGRFPDGDGPAPVPLEQVRETFNFYPRGTSTFGNCIQLPAPCNNGQNNRKFCDGAGNATSGGNLAPHIGIEAYSTFNPAAGEGVKLRARVDDEKEPLPGNIAQVEIVYRINGGAETRIPMVYDAVSGLQQGVIQDCNGPLPGTDPCANPFDVWTLWNGEIPGQSAGAIVEFYLRVVDAQGAEDTTPDVLCPDGVGPCDRDFGGSGCVKDALSSSCTPPVSGLKYVECRQDFRYKVAAQPRAALASVVINEVVAAQDGLLKDTTERACTVDDMCPGGKPECCKFREDFIELHNNSGTQTVDLSGLWLSDGPFNPQVWQFPPGSKILPLEHLIVWLDRDGGKCPDNSLSDKPCFWECPDPTDPTTQEYHANFALNADGDEILLFDTAANGFGFVHGVAFGPQALNHSLALIPSGNRNGCWINSDSPTPRDPNLGLCPGVNFLRSDASANCSTDLSDAIFTLGFLFSGGAAPPCPDSADSNDSGKVDLSDAIYTLGYLFLGSAPPPPPGAETPGTDPTADELGPCIYPSC